MLYLELPTYYRRLIIPDGYELVPTGEFDSNDFLFSYLSNGSKNMSDWNRINFYHGEVKPIKLSGEFAIRIRKKQDIVDDGQPFKVDFKINK